MIGIFDSGLGGLTVARAIMRRLPNWPLVYFGDTARTPYGNKSKRVIEQYAIENTKFLLGRGAKAIVIACNTASALAYDMLKKKFDAPIFEVITPAVEEAIKVTKNGRIGIIGTRATISSGVYERKLETCNLKLVTFFQACPLLVPLIEEGWAAKAETKSILEFYLKPLQAKKIDTLILGCTHYPLLKPLIKKIMGASVTLVDSAEAVASEVARYSQSVSSVSKKSADFFVSDITPHFQSMAEKWLGQKIKIQIATL